MKILDLTKTVALFRLTFRYSGRGRPKKTDYESILIIYNDNGVYEVSGFTAGEKLSKEEMLSKYIELTNPQEK